MLPPLTSRRLTTVSLRSFTRIKTLQKMQRNAFQKSTRNSLFQISRPRAYETLSDESKRKVYDKTGMNADEQE
jgi:DnaJ-class molecular chaperone